MRRWEKLNQSWSRGIFDKGQKEFYNFFSVFHDAEKSLIIDLVFGPISNHCSTLKELS